MEPNEALTLLSQIRTRMARSEVFRGCRALPVAFSGFLAVAAASLQPVWVSDPVAELGTYLKLWIAVAALSILAIGAEMALRHRWWRSPLARESAGLAIGQFLPAVVAGSLVTGIISGAGAEASWLLPGLWAIFFSLGIFAARLVLPPGILGVAIFYLVAGVLILLVARGENALSPWSMGLTFGIGQLYAAAVFYWALERFPAREE